MSLSMPEELELEPESSSRALLESALASSGLRTGSALSPGMGTALLSLSPAESGGSEGVLFDGMTGTLLVSSGKGLADWGAAEGLAGEDWAGED
jgi:hypothetical protein